MNTEVTIPHGEPVRQLSVMLANRVGALAALVKTLRSATVEVIGLSAQDSRDATIARLVLSDPDNAERIFMEKGIPYTASSLIVVSLRESGPDLLRCLDSLMLGETNVDFVYSLLPCSRGHARLALHVEDYEFSASMLHKCGFTLLYQTDLSR